MIRAIDRGIVTAARGRRRGLSSFLAMIYLVIFGSLAVGFYASVNTAVQISKNEQERVKALLAAESGMDYAHHLLSNCRIPAGRSDDETWNLVVQHVRVQAERYSVQETSGVLTLSNIHLDRRMRFTTRLIRSGGEILVSSSGVLRGADGAEGELGRRVQMAFAKTQRPANIFDFGVASAGRIVMGSNARISGARDPALGNVLVTTTRSPALTMSGNAVISGDVSLTAPTSSALHVSSGTSIGGARPGSAGYADNLHLGVETPEYPTVDTSRFKVFAGNPAYGGTVISQPNRKFDTGTLKNILIKANTNPTFDSNIQIQGVVYIETPNKVTFNSNTVITGAIVVQNDPTGNVSTNMIELNSNTQIRPIQTLPATAHFPPELRALTGAAILAPKFYLHMNSNFGAISGTIIAGQMHFDSNAAGSVRGSAINLEDTLLEMNSNAAITVESRRGFDLPVGVVFSSNYAPRPDTYTEMRE